MLNVNSYLNCGRCVAGVILNFAICSFHDELVVHGVPAVQNGGRKFDGVPLVRRTVLTDEQQAVATNLPLQNGDRGHGGVGVVGHG